MADETKFSRRDFYYYIWLTPLAEQNRDYGITELRMAAPSVLETAAGGNGKATYEAFRSPRGRRGQRRDHAKEDA